MTSPSPSTSPLQVVGFHPDHYGPVMSGGKVSTVRWSETITTGPALLVFGEPDAGRSVEGRVLSIESFRLPELTAAAARQPAGVDMTEFVRQLRANYYPDMPDDAEVHVVTFVVGRERAS